jgi:hypothetical protein
MLECVAAPDSGWTENVMSTRKSNPVTSFLVKLMGILGLDGMLIDKWESFRKGVVWCGFWRWCG